MKKRTLVLLLVGLLANGQFLVGMKRKRNLDDDGFAQPAKRRKIQKKKKRESVYDQYLGEGGRYYCPDCTAIKDSARAIAMHLYEYRHGHLKYKKESIYDQYLGKDNKYHCSTCGKIEETEEKFRRHLIAARHGHLQGTIKKAKQDVYAQYLSENGVYRCPTCGYEAAIKGTFSGHIRRLRHGHLEGVKVKARSKKKIKKKKFCDQYLGKNGLYQCPTCGYKTENKGTFQSHLSRKRHGHFEGKAFERKQTKKKGICEQYLTDTGGYRCSTCGYETDSKGGIESHIYETRHGHMQGKKKIKRGASIYDQYRGHYGRLYCSECDYSTDNEGCMYAHLSSLKHGHMRKRKKVSIMDTYRKGKGYCCSTCGHKTKRAAAMQKHLGDKRHGHFLGTKSKGIYDQYLTKDGRYCCTTCGHKTKSKSGMQKHLSDKNHGHFCKKKRNGIYARYRKENGGYRCPTCGCELSSESGMRKHLILKGHGHFKGRFVITLKSRSQTNSESQNDTEENPVGFDQESYINFVEHAEMIANDSLDDLPVFGEDLTLTPSIPVSIFIHEANKRDAKVTVLPVIELLVGSTSFSQALFNAVCLQQNNFDMMHDREQLEQFDGQIPQGISVVSDARMLDLLCLEDNKPTILVVQIADGHWVAMRRSWQEGWHIEVADALYAGFEDFEKLVGIAKRLV